MVTKTEDSEVRIDDCAEIRKAVRSARQVLVWSDLISGYLPVYKTSVLRALKGKAGKTPHAGFLTSTGHLYLK